MSRRAAAALEAEYLANADVRQIFDDLDSDAMLHHVGLYYTPLDRRASEERPVTETLVNDIMASKNETRYGFYIAGVQWYSTAFALEAFRRGAVLGDLYCVKQYALNACSARDPHFYFWYERIGPSPELFAKIRKENAYFAAGRYFVLNDIGDTAEVSNVIIIHSLHVYEKARTATIEAINAWSLISRRLNVGHDVRRLISRLVWNEMESFNVANASTVVTTKP